MFMVHHKKHEKKGHKNSLYYYLHSYTMKVQKNGFYICASIPT